MNLVEKYNRKSLIDNICDFENLYTLHDFPVKMGVTATPRETDICSDMIYIIDRESGMIQLEKLIPLDILYQDAHYNNIASNWRDHHEAFAKFINKWKPESVFEIGGGTGLLAKSYAAIDDKIKWTILEAAPNPVDGCKAIYIKGIFDDKYKIEQGYDAVVHTHTMEHFYNPLDTIKNIATNMRVGSHMFFSIPNLREMYKRRYTNVLNFEHTFFCTDPYVNILLAKSGYEIVEKKLFKDEHSIFYAARRTDKDLKIPSTDREYDVNKSLFMDWVNFHKDLICELNYKINSYVNNEIYLFGAHVFSQYLIAFGLNGNRISGVLDNDATKQGRRLYGTDFSVYSPNILAKKDNPVIILHAGTHNNEIKEGILKINGTAIFI